MINQSIQAKFGPGTNGVFSWICPASNLALGDMIVKKECHPSTGFTLSGGVAVKKGGATCNMNISGPLSFVSGDTTYMEDKGPVPIAKGDRITIELSGTIPAGACMMVIIQVLDV